MTSHPSERRELSPLINLAFSQESRPEAMERCIGPLTALDSISLIDSFRKSVEFASLANRFSTVKNSNNSLGLEDITLETFNTVSNFAQTELKMPLHHSMRTSDREFLTLKSQDQIFSNFTFWGKNRRATMNEALMTQSYLLGTIFIPGLCKVLNINPVSKIGVSKILRRDDVFLAMRSLSFSANGAWEGSNFNAKTKLDKSDTLLSPQKTLSAYSTHTIKLTEDMLNRVTAEQLFEVTDQGLVKASFLAVKILRSYMKADNQSQIANNDSKDASPGRINQSRGCPISIKSVRMHPDDLTEKQTECLTQGSNPIARYDSDQGIFTLLRNPIAEFNHLVADILDPTYRPQV